MKRPSRPSLSLDPGGDDDAVRDGEFRDPQLARFYDVACPPGPDTEFFIDTVQEHPASRVLDLGCGTGQLTVALADAGHRVTGIEPAAASLELARSRKGSESVRWLLGHVPAAPTDAFDTAIMTSHVAQFFADDDSWRAALAHLRRSLVHTGRLVFDSRDPTDRRWERWNPTETRASHQLDDGSEVDQWTETVDVIARPDGGTRVEIVHHYEFGDGTQRTSRSSLAFRPESTLRRDLDDADFDVVELYGGWAREPVGHDDGELIVVAMVR